MSNKQNDELDEMIDEHKYLRYWTTFRMRTSSRDYIEALGKIMTINRNGYLEPRPMNQVLEYLLDLAGKRLLHKDMGASFEHVPSPYCACGPAWPPDKQYVVKKPE